MLVRMSRHLLKYHIVGNHMSWLIINMNGMINPNLCPLYIVCGCHGLAKMFFFLFLKVIFIQSYITYETHNFTVFVEV